jgi:hypothetical protein
MPFIPGTPGPGAGRKPGGKNSRIREILEHIGAESVSDLQYGTMRRKYKMWRKVWDLAETGDLHAVSLIADRLEGKAAQSIDMTTNGKDMAPTVVNVDESKISPEQLEKIFEVIQNARLS